MTMSTITNYLTNSQTYLCIFPVYIVHKKLMVLSTDLDLAEIRFIPTRYWQWSNEPCAMMPVAALQREWGNSVQPVKKPTQVPSIPTAE
jgi:hypothetical protein